MDEKELTTWNAAVQSEYTVSASLAGFNFAALAIFFGLNLDQTITKVNTQLVFWSIAISLIFIATIFFRSKNHRATAYRDSEVRNLLDNILSFISSSLLLGIIVLDIIIFWQLLVK